VWLDSWILILKRPARALNQLPPRTSRSVNTGVPDFEHHTRDTTGWHGTHSHKTHSDCNCFYAMLPYELCTASRLHSIMTNLRESYKPSCNVKVHVWRYKRNADRRDGKRVFIGSALKPHSETLLPHGFQTKICI